MRASTMIVGFVMGCGLTIQASAQEVGTCEHPLSLSEPAVITLDTRLYADHHHPPDGCAGHPATGPDVVIDFGGLPADGEVTWEADFPAILYTGADDCDFSSCRFASTTGHLSFNCGYEPIQGNHHASWHHVYIVVDGIDKAAGLITLNIDFGINVPVSADTWGRIKATYRRGQPISSAEPGVEEDHFTFVLSGLFSFFDPDNRCRFFTSWPVPDTQESEEYHFNIRAGVSCGRPPGE